MNCSGDSTFFLPLIITSLRSLQLSQCLLWLWFFILLFNSCRLVESDSTTQEEVSKMTPFIKKLLIMIEDCQSEIPDYTLFSSQVAANTLFYCTFNVKSAPPLASCGSLTQMISITRHLLVTERGNTALRLEFSANYSVVTFFS